MTIASRPARRVALTILALAALTVAADARAASPAPGGATPSLGQVAAGTIDLAARPTKFALAYGDAGAPAHVGVSRTALDHRFTGDGAVGSVGFLCGLKVPDAAVDGGGPASGFGRPDTFVGARLGLAFR